MIASMAPYGAGQAITAIRPSADTFTLLYVDTYGAVHGCILILPKASGNRVTAVLAESRIFPSEYPKSGLMGSAESAFQQTPANERGGPHSQPSLEVALLTESVDGVPSEFAAAEYEYLVSQLADSGLFANVWRQGDVRRYAGDLVVHVDIRELKKGSARVRGLVPFAGATVIKANLTLTDAHGRTLFQTDVEGTKRTHGENLGAANSLAKKVRKELKKIPNLESATYVFPKQ
jgi:hypothetical protein